MWENEIRGRSEGSEIKRENREIEKRLRERGEDRDDDRERL